MVEDYLAQSDVKIRSRLSHGNQSTSQCATVPSLRRLCIMKLKKTSLAFNKTSHGRQPQVGSTSILQKDFTGHSDNKTKTTEIGARKRKTVDKDCNPGRLCDASVPSMPPAKRARGQSMSNRRSSSAMKHNELNKTLRVSKASTSREVTVAERIGVPRPPIEGRSQPYVVVFCTGYYVTDDFRANMLEQTSPFLGLPTELTMMIAELAYESHVDIWHDTERCRRRCKVLNEEDDQERIRCFSHSTCGCRIEKPKKKSRAMKPWLHHRFRACAKEHRPRVTGLWATCRQMYQETAHLLYTVPIFDFDSVTTYHLWLKIRQRKTLQGRQQNLYVRKIALPFTCSVSKKLQAVPNLSAIYAHEYQYEQTPRLGLGPEIPRSRVEQDRLNDIRIPIVYHTVCTGWPTSDLEVFRNRLRLTGEKPHFGPEAPKVIVSQAGIVLPVKDAKEETHYQWRRKGNKWYIEDDGRSETKFSLDEQTVLEKCIG